MSSLPTTDRHEVSRVVRGARTLTAACVAVVLYAFGGAIGWLSSGSHPSGLGPLAVGAVVVFAVATAVRGLNAVILRNRPGPLPAVMADLAMCVAALAYIGVIGSVNDSAGMTLYSVMIIAGFLLPAAAVVSSVAELVIRSP